ncbi:MAG: helix-turn-helix transcriptional regulator [bacterium]|nr:helix-turn-helix transcriptional regulator [bacterium]
MHLVLKGRTNKDIEDSLYISLNTVKTHIYNIYQKAGVKNRLELINILTKGASG